MTENEQKNALKFQRISREYEKVNEELRQLEEQMERLKSLERIQKIIDEENDWNG